MSSSRHAILEACLLEQSAPIIERSVSLFEHQRLDSMMRSLSPRDMPRMAVVETRMGKTRREAYRALKRCIFYARLVFAKSRNVTASIWLQCISIVRRETSICRARFDCLL